MHSPRRLASPNRGGRPPLGLLAVAAALLGGLLPVVLSAATPAAVAAGGPARTGDVGQVEVSSRVSGRGPAASGLGPATPGLGPAAEGRASAGGSSSLPDHDWLWPIEGARSVLVPFRAPAHDYGPGHRGMDIAATGGARAPADGVIAFRGVVVDRPLLTIDHGNGLVTTFEPVQSELAPGTIVHRGEVIATLSTGGHTPAGALHVGVRWNGVYINPLLLFGDVPRAVLLPCGTDGC
ncbi:murein hydrolase activator EnvC family protein [Microbacterium sp. 2MCAF23]|uniref:murein hydrolase activator EnvC family protein n=1 Tax=Microbacterium sp. 2MCAF23 TaxID=3232985 RepID=UPI003F951900